MKWRSRPREIALSSGDVLRIGSEGVTRAATDALTLVANQKTLPRPSDRRVVVAGRTNPDAELRVGSALVVVEGHGAFSVRAPLREEQETMTLTARDVLGHRVVKRLNIVRAETRVQWK